MWERKNKEERRVCPCHWEAPVLPKRVGTQMVLVMRLHPVYRVLFSLQRM